MNSQERRAVPARRNREDFVVAVISDTVLDIRGKQYLVTTVAELDVCLDRIATDVADHRVHPVEVGIYDSANIETPALFIAVGSSTSYAVYHSRAGNRFTSIGNTATVPPATEFDVSARALIPTDQARQATRQFLTTRQRPNNIVWERETATASP